MWVGGLKWWWVSGRGRIDWNRGQRKEEEEYMCVCV